MTKKEVINRLCATCGAVAAQHKWEFAAGCFCGDNEVEPYRFDAKVLEFIEAAVGRSLAKHEVGEPQPALYACCKCKRPIGGTTGSPVFGISQGPQTLCRECYDELTLKQFTATPLSEPWFDRRKVWRSYAQISLQEAIRALENIECQTRQGNAEEDRNNAVEVAAFYADAMVEQENNRFAEGAKKGGA